ncbi:hypothetical protein L598_004000000120 [Mesorhizobium sp. J18]|nr:hypothetical protein L598_004000000120 [Mesorhizobium sp. J18]
MICRSCWLPRLKSVLGSSHERLIRAYQPRIWSYTAPGSAHCRLHLEYGFVVVIHGDAYGADRFLANGSTRPTSDDLVSSQLGNTWQGHRTIRNRQKLDKGRPGRQTLSTVRSATGYTAASPQWLFRDRDWRSKWQRRKVSTGYSRRPASNGVSRDVRLPGHERRQPRVRRTLRVYVEPNFEHRQGVSSARTFYRVDGVGSSDRQPLCRHTLHRRALSVRGRHNSG